MTKKARSPRSTPSTLKLRIILAVIVTVQLAITTAPSVIAAWRTCSDTPGMTVEKRDAAPLREGAGQSDENGEQPAPPRGKSNPRPAV